MYHHDLEIHPIPKNKQPLYINEPSLIDITQLDYDIKRKLPCEKDDYNKKERYINTRRTNQIISMFMFLSI